MGVSLFDSSVTNATPGVAWLATTDPDTFNTFARVVAAGVNIFATEQVDAAYIVNGANAYVISLTLSTTTLNFHLQPTATSSSGAAGPQFTDDAESNLGLAIQAGGETLTVVIADEVADDTDEPYSWTVSIPSSVRDAIGGASSAQSILVDRSHPNIDWDNLEIADPPEAPSIPTVTSSGTDSISVTLPADPTSDSDITTRDIRYKQTSEGDDAWVEMLNVTSPITISGLDDNTEYEVQWRANMGGVIDTIAVTAVGTGYQTLPTVTITGGGGTGATATAITTGRGGSVSAITITDGGSGYTSAPTVAITGGGGTGATATATYFEQQEGAWSNSRTTTTDEADLMPTVGAIDDVVVEQGEDLDETLPLATGGDLPVTYSMTGLASWMSFDAATRRLTGTAPAAVSSTTLRYIATDTDGDTAHRDFSVDVPLALANFDTDGLETESLALIEALRSGSNSYVWSRAPHNQGSRGVLVDGEMGIDGDNILLNAVRFRRSNGGDLGNGRISIEARDIPGFTGNLRNYFTAADGAGRDLTLHVQSSTHSLSFGVRTHETRHGTDWIRMGFGRNRRAVRSVQH